MTVPVEPGQTPGGTLIPPNQQKPNATPQPNPHGSNPAAWVWPTTTTNTKGGWAYGQDEGNGYIHKGIDIETPMGSPIYAVADSTVGFADGAGDWNSGYGNLIVLDTAIGGFKTFYGHLSEVVVKPGDTVKKGQLIGYTGSTGNSTGPHLHFEVRSPTNTVLDPNKFFGINPSPTSGTSGTWTGNPPPVNVTGYPSASGSQPPVNVTGYTNPWGNVTPPSGNYYPPYTTPGGTPDSTQGYYVIKTPFGNIKLPIPQIDYKDITVGVIGASLVLIGVLGIVLPAGTKIVEVTQPAVGAAAKVIKAAGG